MNHNIYVIIYDTNVHNYVKLLRNSQKEHVVLRYAFVAYFLNGSSEVRPLIKSLFIKIMTIKTFKSYIFKVFNYLEGFLSISNSHFHNKM